MTLKPQAKSMTEQPPRLTGLTIKNYKCLENITLQNLPPVVCLIGKNGSGKSAFLENISEQFKAHYSQIDSVKLKESDNIDNGLVLSTDGQNLPNVAFTIQNDFPKIWEGINETLHHYVKGFKKVISVRDDYRRTFLRFYNQKHEQVLLPNEMSDGTLLMLAHLLLLRNPKPHPILCIDEPEHHLYPSFLGYLAGEIQDYALQAGNVFLTTHSPTLINHLDFESIYYCKKNDDNVTEIYRLSDNEQLLVRYKEDGYLAGDMLRDGLLEAEYN
jgi:predicted ATPase